MARKPKAQRTAEEKLVEECQRRFKECEDRESENLKRWKEDLRFALGDPDNGWQWDDKLRKQRELDARPCLTTNKVKQHNLQIANDARQNKPCIRVYPVDSGADKKTAEIFNGIIRHIESNSSADTAYDTASKFAVDAGLGYWRITTDYAADDSFDQEIYIKTITNPLNVRLGPFTEPDGSDATYGFVFEDMPKEDFEAKYPNAEPIGWPLEGGDEWLGEKTIRVAEYWKIVEETDTLCAGPDGQTFKLSEIEDQDVVKAIQADESYKKRAVANKRCKWYLIAGDQVLEERDWLGKYIPIVRVVGEETIVDGKVYRSGHTRGLKDAQRMYNYWSSAGVEYGALQGKQPYIAPAEAIAGHEQVWNNLNSSNVPYVPYNGVDDQGNKIDRPERQMPPVSAPMYMEGMRVASEEMKMASGQYDASMGAKSNETSGRAILARQQEGDNATFHFVDNVARAIRYTGKILIDLIPKVYDTPRVVRILGEDGEEEMVQVDPQAPKAFQEQQEMSGVKDVYNPSVGRYDLTVSVGPSYGSKRQEAFQALTEMSARNPQLMAVAGDLVMKAADFPMAEELAERLKKTLPPGLSDDQAQIPPEAMHKIQALEEQIQAMGEALNNASQQLDQAEAKAKSGEADMARLQVDSYAKITDRLKVVAPFLTPQLAAPIILETVQQALQDADPLPDGMAEGIEDRMPMGNMAQMQQQEMQMAQRQAPTESAA